MNAPLLTLTSSTTVFAGIAPVEDDSIDVSVEITPLNTVCTIDCPVSEPPATTPGGGLPVTGGEIVSLALPAALVLAGIISLAWARRGRAGRS
jgi:hypothetical protein